ncbi:hypothetical protein VaNZ11_015952 [Volvox africanus]|uniref:CCHC-type domain-containing protein n=1 Tax=Volvox africanus TaxID=51714 RepID=A0ABQ5SMR2_9CHLO|nr:hypothetical protein VaNZ11_015952 [Volvox africanus]
MDEKRSESLKQKAQTPSRRARPALAARIRDLAHDEDSEVEKALPASKLRPPRNFGMHNWRLPGFGGDARRGLDATPAKTRRLQPVNDPRKYIQMAADSMAAGDSVVALPKELLGTHAYCYWCGDLNHTRGGCPLTRHSGLDETQLPKVKGYNGVRKKAPSSADRQPGTATGEMPAGQNVHGEIEDPLPPWLSSVGPATLELMAAIDQAHCWATGQTPVHRTGFTSIPRAATALQGQSAAAGPSGEMLSAKLVQAGLSGNAAAAVDQVVADTGKNFSLTKPLSYDVLLYLAVCIEVRLADFEEEAEEGRKRRAGEGAQTMGLDGGSN